MKLNKNTLFTVLCLLSISLHVNAQIKYLPYSKGTIPADQYEVVDIAFKAKKPVEEPFSVVFGAIFTSPPGEKSFTGGNLKAPWRNEADAILIRRVNN